ncbi:MULTISPECIES: PAS factor family protein [Vibrio]|uniref:PAS factor family protein n=1 Tax=Vibrio TaxID=662 RepID=UPI000C000136|nr:MULTISPECIES: PAS factor family protein [unclassified Vibrio]PHJ40589.1 secretion protein [Vibrio sp. PID17_43]RIZ55310.1 secretion protein [Vibrio sp. PID23_8]
MDRTTILVYDTLMDLTKTAPDEHAKIRQNLYDQLNLPFNKQLTLYAQVLAPASSGKLEDSSDIDNALSIAMRVIETPEH